MIVKILQKSETFGGVRYSTRKIEKDRGELVKVSGFGALQGLDYLRPSDYISYLEAVSARSKRIKYPQLHVTISCKGQSHTKEQLTGIADEWLKGMGYGEQPYLLMFHKDTKNNHLHIVSTRVGRDGKKIDDAFEKLKAYEVLNRVMAQDENLAVHVDTEKALAYNFSTRAQFMMILEAQGYTLKLAGNDYRVIKFGRELAKIPLAKVDGRIAAHQKNKERISQLRAIIERYRQVHDPTLKSLTHTLPGGMEKQAGYTSALSEYLREKFGVVVLFHAKDGKQPYGYTLLDHTKKQVFKGGEIMDLKALIAPVQQEQEAVRPTPAAAKTAAPDSQETSEQTITDAEVATEGTACPHPALELTGEVYDAGRAPVFNGFQIDIADDIDDEAILGRNRQRKRKARTNTR